MHPALTLGYLLQIQARVDFTHSLNWPALSPPALYIPRTQPALMWVNEDTSESEGGVWACVINTEGEGKGKIRDRQRSLDVYS